MTQLIIGIVGKRGSGKGTAAEFLKRDPQADLVATGRLFRNVAAVIGLPATRQNLVRVSEMLVREFGQEVFSRWTLQRARESSAPLLVVEGMRFPEDIAALRTRPRFRLLGIEAPDELRWQRCRDRGDKPDERNMSFADFMAGETRESERYVPDLLAQADFRIQNDGTLLHLYDQSCAALHAFDYRYPGG